MTGPSSYGGRWQAKFAALYIGPPNPLVLAATEGADRFTARQSAPEGRPDAFVIHIGSDGRYTRFQCNDMNVPWPRVASAAFRQRYGGLTTPAALEAHLAPALARKARERRERHRKNASKSRKPEKKSKALAAAKQLRKKHPTWSTYRLARQLKVSPSSLYRWLEK